MADAAADAAPDMEAELKATKKLLKRMQLKEKGYKKMVDDLEFKVAAAQAALDSLRKRTERELETQGRLP